MARGWESKAVEAQIEEGKPGRPETITRPVSPEARLRRQRLQSLKLSQSRLLEQLEHARHTAHRQILLNGLRALEKEIEELKVES